MKWEYKELTRTSAEEIQSHVADGWQVAAVSWVSASWVHEIDGVQIEVEMVALMFREVPND